MFQGPMALELPQSHPAEAAADVVVAVVVVVGDVEARRGEAPNNQWPFNLFLAPRKRPWIII